MIMLFSGIFFVFILRMVYYICMSRVRTENVQLSEISDSMENQESEDPEHTIKKKEDGELYEDEDETKNDEPPAYVDVVQ